MPFGAELQTDGGVHFRLFAPAASSVRLALDEQSPNPHEPLDMCARVDGWYALFVPIAGAGTRYCFVLPDGSRVPDPVSRFQPLGINGPSEVIDPIAFRWSDAAWRGRCWTEAVLYELHVGAFTPEGTFRAAAAKLDHLAALGITGIELMCLCAFAGQRSWGYDGVLLFAPDSTYGRPDDLKAFVDAAHARGLTIILDVVYNHFGPEGNYLPRYFPQIFSAKHKTAWGAALNFDGPGNNEVRELIVHNALYWLEEFHVDGLRLDATHALLDDSPHHILNELAERIRAVAGNRRIHLILENEQTIVRLLTRSPDGSETAYTAQWNHAIDHLLGMAMGGDCNAQDKDARHETEELGKALAEGFAARNLNCPLSEAKLRIPSPAFVSFIQTHDLVGNRVAGERIHALAPPEAVRAIATIYLLLPQVPMLFMGEEWDATTPFPFFSDYGGELAEAVRQGRHKQLAATGQHSEEELNRAPDPQAESTFLSAKLNWNELVGPLRAPQIDWYKRILAVRRNRLTPLLSGLVQSCGRFKVIGPGRLSADWELADGAKLFLAANLCHQPSSTFASAPACVLWLEGSQPDSGSLGPWTVRWSLRV